jgi:AraC-like DNA-binding protein
MKYYDLQFPTITDFTVRYYMEREDDCQPAKLYPPHIHDCLEFYILFEGESAFMVEDKLYKIKPGDVVMSKPNHLHNCVRNREGVHKNSCIWIDANTGFLSADFLDGEIDPVISLDEKDKRTLFGLYDELEEASKKNDERKIFRLIVQITEIYRDNLVKKGSAEKEKIPAILKQILLDIKENFATLGHLDYFTKKYFISQSTLNRLFKKHLHTSPKLYLESKRLAHARVLLKSGKQVKEACELAGFTDYSNFIRLFKKRFAITPKEYQNR